MGPVGVSAACLRVRPGVRLEAEDPPLAVAVAFSEACGTPRKLTTHAAEICGALSRGVKPVLMELAFSWGDKRPDRH